MKNLAGLFAAVLVVGVGAAQAKRPMTFADLMAMKRVSDPQISPSGKWVMFSVTEVSLEKNSKVNHLVGGADLPGAEERQMTMGIGERDQRAVFAGWEVGVVHVGCGGREPVVDVAVG